MNETLSQKEWAKNVSGHCKQTERHTGWRQRKTLRPRRDTDMTICTSSLIRTMTVGSGIAPDLLTPWFGS
jgi:hypothetical protein